MHLADRGGRRGRPRRGDVAGTAARVLGQPGRGQSAGERDHLAGARARPRPPLGPPTRRCATRRRLGLLHGVPMAHKDMYYQAGKLSTCGSALRRDFRPTVTATVIERLARGRRLHLRRPEHGGVRAEPDRPQQDVRRLPQSVEPALHHRRVVVRVRRLGRGAVQLSWRWARTPAARSGCRPRPAA